MGWHGTRGAGGREAGQWREVSAEDRVKVGWAQPVQEEGLGDPMTGSARGMGLGAEMFVGRVKWPHRAATGAVTKGEVSNTCLSLKGK